MVRYRVNVEEHVTLERGHRFLEKGEVTFTLGDYAPTEPLIIDPALIYFSYLGGNDQDRVKSTLSSDLRRILL